MPLHFLLLWVVRLRDPLLFLENSPIASLWPAHNHPHTSPPPSSTQELDETSFLLQKKSHQSISPSSSLYVLG
uniref:Transposable element Tcb1 transposase n=1 Tax=Phakopsora pachyrhizi TaxID=170000 RepID=A0A0S1MJL9_PHAPC